MDNLTEVQSLITVRQYIQLMTENYNLKKSDVADLRAMIILIDNKITGLLLGDDFKKYINFDDARRATAAAAEINNIKSGLIKKQ